MLYVIIAIAVVWAIISAIVDEGGFLSKFALGAVLAAVACLLIFWITDLDFMITLAKICGAATVLAVLIALIGKIAG